MRLLSLLFAVLLLGCSESSEELLHRINIPFPEIPPGALDYRDTSDPEGRPLYPGLFGHSRPIHEVYSPARDAFAGTSEGNLYVRANDVDSMEEIANAEPGWQWDVEGAKWNPEGTRLLVRQIDTRELGTITLTDEDGNERERTYSYIGDPLEKHQYYVVEVGSKRLIKIPHEYEMPYIHAIGWHQDMAYILRSDRMMRNLELLKVDPETGEFSAIITESSDAFIIGLNMGQHYDERLDDANYVDFHDDFIVWTSERSGFRQLYLYDTDGNYLRELTKHENTGTVSSLMMLRDGWAYFSTFDINVGNAESLSSARFVRASLETGKVEVLVEDAVIITSFWPEDEDNFWVGHGDLHRITVTSFDGSGNQTGTYWEHKLVENEDFGYAPEYVWTKAPDSEVLIGSAILKPKDFDASKTYPVIELVYPAPYYNVMPYAPFDGRSRQMQDLANEGYIVVLTDARGKEYRGREYHNYSYGRVGQVEITDHAHVLETLGKDRPYMDMDRVGITGHSMGGYFSLRAMILRPDLYKVGHINAPNIDPDMLRIATEPYYGCLPSECPENYAGGSVIDRVDKLEGSMMLTFGTADEHIPVSEVYRLTAAMDGVGYDKYELEIVPGMNHQVHRNPEWYPKMVAFFERELKNMSITPTAGAKISP